MMEFETFASRENFCPAYLWPTPVCCEGLSLADVEQ